MTIWNGKPVCNNTSADEASLATLLRLLDVAHDIKRNAYAPYSGFQVGAAVLAKNSEIITGVNVENGSLGLTICAERTALSKAVSEGYRPGDFVAIAVAASVDGFSPCGACREVINEFGQDMTVVFVYEGEVVITPLKTLLTYNFVEGKPAS